MTDAPASPPPRMLRGILLWTALILLALGLAWFIGAVVVPVWGVRAVLARASNMKEEPGEYVIQGLGGGRAAARRLGLYLRLPGFLVPHRRLAAAILGQCGYDSDSELLHCAADGDPEVRVEAIEALVRHRGAQVTELLMRGLRDPDRRVRLVSASALGGIGPEASASVPLLKKCLSDGAEPVRSAAAEALRKIRGEEAGK